HRAIKGDRNHGTDAMSSFDIRERNSLLFLDSLKTEGNVDLVAYGADQAIHAEIAAFKSQVGGVADAGHALGKLRGLASLEGEGDGFGDAVHGQVPGHGKPALAGFDARALEGDGRKLLDVEEIGALEMAVPLGDPGIDAVGLDGQVETASLVRDGKV